MQTRLVLASAAPLQDPALFARGLASVSAQRRAKIARLRSGEAKRTSLGAALLLDRLLTEAGLPPAGDFAFKPEGKPYLPGRPDVRFSLSHSGELVLCALSDGEIGCDVERPRPFDPALVRRFFHESEQRWLFSLPEGEQSAAFLRLWTLKESYLKALGLGLALPLDAFCILPAGDAAVLTAADAEDWALRSWPGAAWSCAVCARALPFTLEQAALFP